MKLLGLLPLASVTGIFLVGRSDAGSEDSRRLIAFVTVFAATFTLALFLYEIRGILMCTELTCRGCAIEAQLEIPGQFSTRRDGHWKLPFVNAISAACFIYSVVFAGWLFLALHRGFNREVTYCTLYALGSGIVMASLTAHWVNRQINRIHKAEAGSE